MRLIATWVMNTLALLVLPYLMHTVQVDNIAAAALAAAALGLVNTVIRPVLVVLTLPITLFTLGLFILVINGLLFWMVARLVTGFEINGFWSATGAALLYSVISWAFSTLVLTKND
ncbi:MAG: phage holin family protein [Burkholderiaceae bacterium]